MSGKRKVFWLTDQITPEHKSRALVLHHKGFEAQFFTSRDSLISELQSQRAAIIVLSDDGDSTMIKNTIITLMSQPEVQGARMILTSRKHDPRLLFLAASAGFRDIIPLDIGPNEWLQRFVFATASRPLNFVRPTGQITSKEIAGISLPGRITWISGTKIRIESRVQPPRGATLSLTGPLCDQLGVPSLTLTVAETAKENLVYRFSDAITCDWSAPGHAEDRVQVIMNELAEGSSGPKSRIFVAAQDPELRNNLLSRFEDPKYNVSAALQKQAIVNEPRFFSPQLVLIELALCIGENRNRFEEMLNNVPENTYVVVIGVDKEIEQVKNKYPMKKIISLPRVPRNFQQSIIRRYLPEALDASAPADAVHIEPEHVLSLTEINFGVRLVRIHPKTVQIAMPFAVGNFALCRLESPWVTKAIGKAPYIKFVKTYRETHPQSAPFLYAADCSLSTLDSKDRKKLAESLYKKIVGSMEPFLGGLRSA